MRVTSLKIGYEGYVGEMEECGNDCEIFHKTNPSQRL